MDRLIFGTYRISQNDLPNALELAYKYGIRRFDTAQLYKNEQQASTLLPKNDVSITTKIRHIGDMDEMKSKILLSQECISESQLHTILLHRPMPKESWHALEQFSKQYDIGISNYNIDNLEHLKTYANHMPCINQIEFHPFCPDSLSILEWCKKNNIRVQGHTILANTKFFDHPTILVLSKMHCVSPAKIMLRWAFQHDVDLVLSAIEESHIKEWISVATDSFVLTQQQMNLMNNLSTTTQLRLYDNSWAPWIWNERAISDYIFVEKTIQQLQKDITDLINGNRVSESALVIPSIKDPSVGHIAKSMAECLFPPKPLKNDPNKINASTSYIEYNKITKKLKDCIFLQRNEILYA